MVIDSSAIVAILLPEWDREVFIDAIDNDPVRLISSLIALETSIVLEARKGPVGVRELDLFLHRANVQNVGLGPVISKWPATLGGNTARATIRPPST